LCAHVKLIVEEVLASVLSLRERDVTLAMSAPRRVEPSQKNDSDRTSTAPDSGVAPAEVSWDEATALRYLEQVAENDTSAPEDVGQLFAEYQRYVAKIGSRILDTNSEVDDLVQDVFLATLSDVHTLRDRSRVKGWLATVTTRMATRRRSRRRITRYQQSDLDSSLEVPCDKPSPELNAEASGTVKRLLSLPPELRQAWMLKHVEGATLNIVAERCGCSMSTAQRRIRLASLRILGTRR
jgi:RNA polymerase sigma factor (sigma-70 family)